MRAGGARVNPEDTARNHQFREGFRLVDYGAVGLPIFRLTIEAVTMSYRTMPAYRSSRCDASHWDKPARPISPVCLG
jgi:hypothetical protein